MRIVAWRCLTTLLLCDMAGKGPEGVSTDRAIGVSHVVSLGLLLSAMTYLIKGCGPLRGNITGMWQKLNPDFLVSSGQ